MSNLAAFWVKLLDIIDKDGCIDMCLCEATDIQQYITLIQWLIKHCTKPVQHIIINCEMSEWRIYKCKYKQLSTIPWVIPEESVEFCCFSWVSFSRCWLVPGLPARSRLARGSAVPGWLVLLQLLRSLLGAGTGCLLSWAHEVVLAPFPWPEEASWALSASLMGSGVSCIGTPDTAAVGDWAPRFRKCCPPLLHKFMSDLKKYLTALMAKSSDDMKRIKH